MKQETYLTPRKFLQCCGIKKSKCTNMVLGAYLGEQFLNIPIYTNNGSFDTYFISQTEVGSSRFFMDPPKGRRSMGKTKIQDIYAGLTDEVMQSVVKSIEERMKNPVLQHPDFVSVLQTCRENGWKIEPTAMADIMKASNKKESVRMMILLLAALSQDYYEVHGIGRRVRAFLAKADRPYSLPKQRPSFVQETVSGKLGPVSNLRTEQTYVRRGDLLQKMQEKLKKNEDHGEKRFLLLFGAPGEGKSELARAYAKENAGRRYKKEYWLSCPDGETRLSLLSLCRKTYSEQTTTELLARISGSSADILLIVDNLNIENTSLINELYYHTGEATVLITSRLSNLAGFDAGNALAVHSEDQAEFCYELFRKNYEKKENTKQQRRLDESDREMVEEICRRVYLNPLFVSMIASFLREHGSRINIAAFHRNLEKGLLEAFPKYSRLNFKKDAAETMQLEPLEVLEVIFREELSCLRCFSAEERQVINLMALFPAEKLPMSFVSEILGDNEEQCLMEMTIGKLQSLSLLQMENDSISIHPLICELLRTGILMENHVPVLYESESRDAFYTHILENLFLFDWNQLHRCSYVVRHLYQEIRKPKLAAKLLYHSLISKEDCVRILKEELPELKEPAILTYWNGEKGRTYALYKMLSKRTEILLDLSERGYENRYFNEEFVCFNGITEDESVFKGKPAVMKDAVVKKTDGLSSAYKEKDEFSEAVLLLYYEGNHEEKHEENRAENHEEYYGKKQLEAGSAFDREAKPASERAPEGAGESGKETLLLDLSDGIAGHPVYTIPDLFFRRSNRKFTICFPENLQLIGDWVFDNCQGLSGELVLPETLEHIGKGAFHRCTALKGQIRLPDSLKYIDDFAFCVCSGFTGPLILPKHLEYLGDLAFGSCNGLAGPVRCPSTLKRIGENIFYNSRRLIPDPAFSKVPVGELSAYPEKGTCIYLPPMADTIEDRAFAGRSNLTGELKLPVSVREIGDIAFYRCRSLTGTLKFSSALRKIGQGAFYSCQGLSGGIDLPDTLEKIEDGAFMGCSGMNGSLRLSRTMKEIPTACFCMCRNLKEIENLEELQDLKVIREGAFFECEQLQGKLYLPPELESIEDGAFDMCRNLTGLYFSRSSNMKRLGDGCFHGCSGLKGTLDLPGSIEYVGFGCFHSAGIQTVVIHNADCSLQPLFVMPDVELVGWEGSTAEAYAKQFGNPFRIL